MDSAADEAEVSALFQPGTDMTGLLRELELTGLERDDVDICSPLPLEHSSVTLPFTWVPYWITLVAGAVGIAVGVFFAAGTAVLYPIETGGKGIVAPPVVGIISYETMMLLAVVVTFLTMIVRVRSDRGARLRPIDDAMVQVVIRPARKGVSDASVRSVLERAGAIRIQTQSSELRGFEPILHPGGMPSV
jgi:hypothetical protein